MALKGSSAQKNVQWCTFFCAIDGRGDGEKVEDQISEAGEPMPNIGKMPPLCNNNES
jgi:hypothetical protein